MILSAIDQRGEGTASRVSANSASRKLESVALLIPTTGVLVLSQLVIGNACSPIGNYIDLTGLQWYWIFDNTDVALVNGLSVGDLLALSVSSTATISATTMAGTFLLAAVDVIHSVALPTLGVKADAIPGRLVNVRLTSEVAGSFSGQCSELCGAMHAFMPLQVVVKYTEAN